MRVDLYGFCRNNIRLVRHFLRHYAKLVDHCYIQDFGSTDDTIDVLRSYPNVKVRQFDTAGNSFVDAARRLSDTVWRKSRGVADWVVVVDIEEFVFHPDFRGYLSRCNEAGITAFRGIGFDMVSTEFPEGDSALTSTITRGSRSPVLDKLCVFKPDAIDTTRFTPGRHLANPAGHVVWPSQREILLLRYLQLGVPYVIERSTQMKEALRDGDLKNSWGAQYLRSPAEITNEWRRLDHSSQTVPGLGELRSVDSADFDEESRVARTGLLDALWYLQQFPDVAVAGADPVTHFCVHGWREGRQPNEYFEPDWYLDHHPPAREAGGNPLLHYARHGEQAGAWPSPRFDPVAYRRRHGLTEGQSPLRHYLENRPREASVPISDSAVIQYGEPGGSWARRGEVMPSYREITKVLGVDLVEATNPVTVDPRALLEVLGRFLQQVDVDEEGYRLTYPDVAEAIDRGDILSARDHYLEFGYFEGRDPTPPIGHSAG